MWNSIENLKQNLNQIALDVHGNDVEEELAIYDRRNDFESPVSSSTPITGASSERRRSRRFANSNSSLSSFPNVNDSTVDFETEKYKNEIRRLKDSESELKALTMNYSALVKEKEDLISRLNQENGSLKENLETTKEALSNSRNENSRTLANKDQWVKECDDQTPVRRQKTSAQLKGRLSEINGQNGVSPNQYNMANGTEHSIYPVISMKTEQTLRSAQEKEHDQVIILQQNLKEERELNHSLREELRVLDMDKNKISEEMAKIRFELGQKVSEVKRLQIELRRLNDDESCDSLKKVITSLETENNKLKMANSDLTSTLQNIQNSSSASSASNLVENEQGIALRQEMELKFQKLEKESKQACHERDKAIQELKRLKQHLLEKESEDAEKMDEDSKIIEELRLTNEQLKSQVLHLDKRLKQAIASRNEVGIINKKEIEDSKKIIEDLNKQLSSCMSTIESKNIELLNLQTALGQYFAEMEAKEHMGRQLALTKEELAKLSSRLKAAEQEKEVVTREKDEILFKLSHADKLLLEGKHRINNLEEDNSKLRRAIEQGMDRLNRMSIDSDYLVDRRIVIKLLVTYFQRSHSKEVLDLMVRMLGFTEDDKQRIGVAQQGGKGVVRGVLGLPGRLVGGILGGNDGSSNDLSENQSFADLWVDFLLKENEERERKATLDEAGRRTEGSPERLAR